MSHVRMELTSGSSNNQGTSSYLNPSGGITSPNAGGMTDGLSSGYSEWRSLYFTFSTHYAYKERYIADFTVRADGTTKFGPGNRWGYFPSVSAKWIISDEPWMKWSRKWLSMLAIRPSWGRVGNQPGSNYLYTSKYRSSSDKYIDMSVMYPENIRLTDLKWEIVSSYNLGFDLGFFDGRLTMAIEGYRSTTSDMLISNYRIPSNVGFSTLPYRNSGKMRNTGWEFHVNTNKLIKKGKFSLDFNINFGNNRNEILEMDEYVLSNYNSVFGYNNAETLRRVQLNNPLGAIYGFRYKGVYQYNYNTFSKMSREEQEQFIASGKTAPVAINANGEIVRDFWE